MSLFLFLQRLDANMHTSNAFVVIADAKADFYMSGAGLSRNAMIYAAWLRPR